ncbi:cytidine deaminase-like [Condylostylus longicornis]|uniref:cytidine deaminase-like n=1 Tax=Condylostylus longicornis TaxID=2530218 RepID=UPI00244DA466|nr:cytidine deaminase-like [Condylostylus longicornis]XP_055380210.1 cytidine deaminase-like [Condylostylus longicornis]
MDCVNGSLNQDDIKEFKSLDSEVQELINAAIKARTFSYSPYSNFAVGAAIRTENGQIYTGCNVENAAFSSSICAERTAACKAISEGHKVFTALAVVGQQEKSFTTPCGVCRQFLFEFVDNDFPVYVAKPSPYRVLCTTISSLLPRGFKTYIN